MGIDTSGGTPADQMQDGRSPGAGTGGGPGASDMGAGGGSSGSGGYGKAQNQQFHQGQQGDASVADPEAGDLIADQQAHQDRGQSAAEAGQDG